MVDEGEAPSKGPATPMEEWRRRLEPAPSGKNFCRECTAAFGREYWTDPKGHPLTLAEWLNHPNHPDYAANVARLRGAETPAKKARIGFWRRRK